MLGCTEIKKYLFILEPALVKPTDDTAAVMMAFDEYSSLFQKCIDPFVFIPKCVSYGILSGDDAAIVGGGAVFLTNEIKMDLILSELRNTVFHRGIEVFKKILHVFRTEPIYVELADHIESKALHHACIYTKCIHNILLM